MMAFPAARHLEGRQTRMRKLREQIQTIEADMESMWPSLYERAQRYGWEDAQVVRGSRVLDELEKVKRCAEAALRDAMAKAV